MLESKWPTSHATADQLWTKLRNVVMAVAYFKRGSSFCITSSHHIPLGGVGLRYGAGIGPSHPQILHSNSESDPDRQSMDSYLDSVSVEASSISTAVVPGTQSSIVSNITRSGGQADLPAEDGKHSSGSRSPRKFFLPENNQKQFSDEPGNNSNSRPEELARRISPDKSKLEGPTGQPSGSRQRARSTSEVGGDIDLIGIIKHKSKESISAGFILN